ncbi:metallo-beta-lactamase domain-containing protein 1 [Drosophila pseudoobscura]|uniref:Metallo-beta-lactamase domain-containing protein 1 n=1 Tax=Drosophila pseudoobscura pseudoobscura TaxID=46245 RepID=A0A6I8UL08_DROPS|nr:metallo-beta-lactamase domain-containing protein 1 [Drosophila pseudoobscura]
MTAPAKNQVIVLQPGYSHEDENDETAMRANCTCTLIRCRDGQNIIVDTMTAWDGDLLQSLLRHQGLEVEDIHVVVCTHGHSDHIGCNYLFKKARIHMVGACASNRDLYFDHLSSGDINEKKQLDTNGEVVVKRTPGHTLSCVSVIVQSTQLGGTVGIAGDLFERREDVEDDSIWRNAGSEDENSQRVERSKMGLLCDHIVPGHGPMFPLTTEMRLKLKRDAELS